MLVLSGQVDALSEIGVPAKKIRLVFNMLGTDEQPERVFAGLFEYQATAKSFTLRPDAVIHLNDIYGKLKGASQSIKQVLDDPTDFKQMIKETKDSSQKLHYAQLLSVKRLATGVYDELNAVFAALFR